LPHDIVKFGLIPELVGRIPAIVTLDDLDKEALVKILREPKNSITFQYEKLLSVDNVELVFEDDAIDELSAIAEEENETMENIGARRLHTLMEKLLEEISFVANGEEHIKVVINRGYVQKVFKDKIKSHDLKKYVL